MTQIMYILGDTVGWACILFLVYYTQKKHKFFDERLSWLTEKIDETDREIYCTKEMGRIERKREMDAIFSRLMSLETRVFDLRDRLDNMEKGAKIE